MQSQRIFHVHHHIFNVDVLFVVDLQFAEQTKKCFLVCLRLTPSYLSCLTAKSSSHSPSENSRRRFNPHPRKIHSSFIFSSLSRVVGRSFFFVEDFFVLFSVPFPSRLTLPVVSCRFLSLFTAQLSSPLPTRRRQCISLLFFHHLVCRSTIRRFSSFSSLPLTPTTLRLSVSKASNSIFGNIWLGCRSEAIPPRRVSKFCLSQMCELQLAKIKLARIRAHWRLVSMSSYSFICCVLSSVRYDANTATVQSTERIAQAKKKIKLLVCLARKWKWNRILFLFHFSNIPRSSRMRPTTDEIAIEHDNLFSLFSLSIDVCAGSGCCEWRPTPVDSVRKIPILTITYTRKSLLVLVVNIQHKSNSCTNRVWWDSYVFVGCIDMSRGSLCWWFV